jgi:hypothetical protein
MYVAFILVAGILGQTPDLPPVIKDFSKRATFYYRSPDPTLGPKMLQELLKKENIEHPWFAQNGYVLGLIGAQLGDIACGNPKIVREYEAAFPDAALTGRKVVVRALRNCGDKDTVKKIDAWLADPKYADVQGELKDLKKHLEDPNRRGVRDRPATSPDDLDLLWCNFFITGEYAPISRILDVLDLPDARENEVLKRVARWSLGSNLQQHPKLVQLVREHAKQRAAGSRKAIDEMILSRPKNDTK